MRCFLCTICSLKNDRAGRGRRTTQQPSRLPAGGGQRSPSPRPRFYPARGKNKTGTPGAQPALGALGTPLDDGQWPMAVPSLGNLRALPVPPASPACATLGNPLPPAGRRGWRKDAFFRTGRDRKALLPARFLPSHLLFPINGEKKPSASAPRSSQCSSQGRLSTSQEKRRIQTSRAEKNTLPFFKGKTKRLGRINGGKTLGFAQAHKDLFPPWSSA